MPTTSLEKASGPISILMRRRKSSSSIPQSRCPLPQANRPAGPF
jgi:hypothetical protein